MVCREKVTVINSLGLHARPASMLVQVASGYNSDIMLSKDGMQVNAKSIMGVMMLAAEMGAEVEIEAEGRDATEAVAAIRELFTRKFDEE
ncbi:phosphocarrier protein HPr [candidate division WOR-3 bacterium JGI_Cruoil_03_44_89]|uniref:Phosphocarrier protein HPr n=1 Tax=candidate division WOR-3 bacterium JGI_Cruoil_03_44_89 TaxID=1973748 RepID=A0A235BNU3_UNCW3|nr:MAG: phosphocarrier protein HPr [candidate division WOR-3 bacterium JGI_Cruoil_03_44_89]